MKKLIQRKGYNGKMRQDVIDLHLLQPRAELACELIRCFGAVACAHDGETSSGRQKLRLQTPEELVTRCCEIANTAHNHFQKLGWVLDVPEPTPESET